MSVERIIKDSIREAEALERLLEDERRALESLDAEALGAAAREKGQRASRLEALEAARVAAGAATAGANPALSASAVSWRQFLAIIARCNTLNTTNGAIIRLRREQVTDALRIVSGTGAGTYGPSGSESTSRARQPLAAA
jgi:flagellar biosynthesis/type III secretory pathway chaperone